MSVPLSIPSSKIDTIFFSISAESISSEPELLPSDSVVGLSVVSVTDSFVLSVVVPPLPSGFEHPNSPTAIVKIIIPVNNFFIIFSP